MAAVPNEVLSIQKIQVQLSRALQTPTGDCSTQAEGLNETRRGDGAPAHPSVAGAIAGMLSAGLAATMYASHCTDDSPLFVATWYSIATALVSAIGALAGSRILRF